MTVLRRFTHRAEGDGGSATLELVILTPVVLSIVSLLVFAGRTAMAHQAVETAAADAARQASIARDATTGQSAALSSARTDLISQGLHCISTSVDVNTAAFQLPVGTPGQITTTVTCVLNLSDVSIPGVPGTKTITAAASSPLDTYRDRS